MIRCAGEASFVAQISEIIERHAEFADLILQGIEFGLEFLLRTPSIQIRSLYVQLVEKSLAFGSEPSRQQFIENIWPGVHEILPYWQNFDHFFRPLLFLARSKSIDESWDDRLSALLNGLITYLENNKQEHAWSVICLTAILDTLSELTRKKPIPNLLSSRFVDCASMNPVNLPSFTKLVEFSLKSDPNIVPTVRNEEQPATLAFLLVVLVSHGGIVRAKAFIDQVYPMIANLLSHFWPLVRICLPDDPALFTSNLLASMGDHLPLSLYAMGINTSLATRALLWSLSEKVPGWSLDELFVALLGHLNKVTQETLEFCGSSGSQGLADDEYKQHLITIPYFESLTELAKRCDVREIILQNSNNLVATMKKLGSIPRALYSRGHCWNFIFETMGNCPGEFFANASYSDFLCGFNNFGYTPGVNYSVLALLQFMPPNGIVHFVRSELFRLLCGKLFSEALGIGAEFQRFLLRNLTNGCLKSAMASLWDSGVFRVCAFESSLLYFQTTWRLLKKFPESSNYFYSMKCHSFLWTSIFERDKEITSPKLFLRVLAQFNSGYVRLNSNARTWLGAPVTKRLADFYGKTLKWDFFFDLLMKDGALANGESGACRFLLSLTALCHELAEEILKRLVASKFLFCRDVPFRSRKFVPVFLAGVCHLCHRHRDDVSLLLQRELHGIAESQQVMYSNLGEFCEELVAALRPSSKAVGLELPAGIATICLLAGDVENFPPSLVELMLLVGDLRCAVTWSQTVMRAIITRMRVLVAQPESVRDAARIVQLGEEFMSKLQSKFQDLPWPELPVIAEEFGSWAQIFETDLPDEGAAVASILSKWLVHQLSE
jgi:hypothetical protein